MTKILFQTLANYLPEKIIYSLVINYVKGDDKKKNRLLSYFQKDIYKQSQTYPSLINDGYRHIEKVIEIVNNFGLRDDFLILDVGGAGGEISKMFAENFPKSLIYSFEPLSANFQRLEENIKSYSNIKAFNFGLGNATNDLKINLTDRITSSSLFSLQDQITNPYLATNLKKVGEEIIRIKTLDEVVSPENKISILKLDVQGYELEVLKGGNKTLHNTFCILLEMQNHDHYVSAPKYFHLDEYLRLKGFELVDIIPSIRDGIKLYEWDGIYINSQLV